MRHVLFSEHLLCTKRQNANAGLSKADKKLLQNNIVYVQQCVFIVSFTSFAAQSNISQFQSLEIAQPVVQNTSMEALKS